MAAIELSGLTKRYRRGKGWFTAVNDVTLSAPPGEVIGLLGPERGGQDHHDQDGLRADPADGGHDPAERLRRGTAAQ